MTRSFRLLVLRQKGTSLELWACWMGVVLSIVREGCRGKYRVKGNLTKAGAVQRWIPWKGHQEWRDWWPSAWENGNQKFIGDEKPTLCLLKTTLEWLSKRWGWLTWLWNAFWHLQMWLIMQLGEDVRITADRGIFHSNSSLRINRRSLVHLPRFHGVWKCAWVDVNFKWLE